MFRVLALLLLGIIPTFACENRVFNLSVQDYSISANAILKEFSTACAFSVIWDEAEVESRLAQKLPMINFKDKDLLFILDLLFDALNLHYSFENDVLHLKLQDTKTFKINYLNLTF